jgi:hypothetical protein
MTQPGGGGLGDARSTFEFIAEMTYCKNVACLSIESSETSSATGVFGFLYNESIVHSNALIRFGGFASTICCSCTVCVVWLVGRWDIYQVYHLLSQTLELRQ